MNINLEVTHKSNRSSSDINNDSAHSNTLNIESIVDYNNIFGIKCLDTNSLTSISDTDNTYNFLSPRLLEFQNINNTNNDMKDNIDKDIFKIYQNDKYLLFCGVFIIDKAKIKYIKIVDFKSDIAVMFDLGSTKVYSMIFDKIYMTNINDGLSQLMLN